jgi:hypothetical protein
MKQVSDSWLAMRASLAMPTLRHIADRSKLVARGAFAHMSRLRMPNRLTSGVVAHWRVLTQITAFGRNGEHFTPKTAIYSRTVGILNRFRTRGPEGEFWDWFEDNEPLLFVFERDQDRIFSELAEELELVHPDLTFEFGPVIAGRREFVVSAGGVVSAFSAVEDLIDAAPHLARWRFRKFRPRRFLSGHVSLGDLEIDAREVSITCHPDGDRWGLTVHLPGYEPTPDNRYEQIGYVWLDQSLGEYDVETKLSYIDFAPPGDYFMSIGDVSLNRLPGIIDGPSPA